MYGVPVYRLIGAKRRDRVRIYADTTDHKDPKIYAERMRKRKEMGLTFFKMDLHTELIADRPNAVNERGVATDKGLGYLCEFIAAIRDVIGWTAPLEMCIRDSSPAGWRARHADQAGHRAHHLVEPGGA